MFKFAKLQQLFLSSLVSIILLFFGLSILIISLYFANRQQAASIKQVTTEVIKLYTN